MLMAVHAWLDAGFDADPPPADTIAVIVGGHNLNQGHQYTQRLQFADEPDYMDPLLALNGLDTDHAGCVSEVLQARGPIYTVGAACASANAALRCAVDEIRYHGADSALVIGPILDFSPLELHAMALMGAITFQSFNDCPEKPACASACECPGECGCVGFRSFLRRHSRTGRRRLWSRSGWNR